MIYVVVFLYTTVAAYFVEHSKSFDKKKRSARIQEIMNDSSKTKRKKLNFKKSPMVHIGLFLMSFPMVMVHACRYGFATDYNGTYLKIFRYVQSDYGMQVLKRRHVEIGFLVFDKLVSLFTSDHVWSIFLVSIFTLGVMVYAVYRTVDNFHVAIAMIFLSGLYMDFTNLIRQGIAVCLFSLSIQYLYKRQFKPYIACIIIGALFHISVLAMIPLFFLYGIRLKKGVYAVIVAVAVAGGNIIYSLIIYIIGFIPKYRMYLMYMNEGTHLEKTYIIIFSIVFILAFVFGRDTNFDSFWTLFTSIGLAICLLSARINFLVRFMDYFLLAYVFFFPPFVISIKKKVPKAITKWGVYGVTVAFQMYTVFISNWYFAIPYVSIFNR